MIRKVISCVLFSFSLFSFKRGSNSFDEKISLVSSSIYGPFDGQEKIIIDVNYKSGINTQFIGIAGIKIFNVNDLNNTIYSTYEKNGYHVFKNQIYTFSFDIDFSSFFNQNRLVIQFIVQKKTSLSIVSSRLIYLNKNKEETIYLSEKNNFKHINKEYTLCFSNEEKMNEEVDFSISHNSFLLDSYGCIKLNIPFLYKFYKTAIYNDVYIEFDDANNLFPEIKKGGNNLRIIPLKFNYFSNDYGYITSSDRMYYNPTTNELSSIKRSGYLKTNKLHFPPNKKSLISKYTFTLVLAKFGHCKKTYKYNFNFTFGRNYLGSCSSSDYCIIGGLK